MQQSRNGRKLRHGINGLRRPFTSFHFHRSQLSVVPCFGLRFGFCAATNGPRNPISTTIARLMPVVFHYVGCSAKLLQQRHTWAFQSTWFGNNDTRQTANTRRLPFPRCAHSAGRLWIFQYGHWTRAWLMICASSILRHPAALHLQSTVMRCDAMRCDDVGVAIVCSDDRVTFLPFLQFVPPWANTRKCTSARPIFNIQITNSINANVK